MTTKKPKDTEKILEIVVAVFLGIAALATAWASWIGSLHGGNQATNYTTSNNLSAEGNAEWNEASQQLMQDMMLWNQISEASLNQAYAEEKGDEMEAEKYSYLLDQLLDGGNVSDEFSEAIDWALSKEEEVSPFDMDGYVDSYFENARDIIAESDELLEEGKKDNANGDAFGLVVVIYSVVLFLLGIVGTFKNIPNRVILLVVAIVIFLFATIYMFTLPLPTGFNILSFFAR